MPRGAKPGGNPGAGRPKGAIGKRTALFQKIANLNEDFDDWKGLGEAAKGQLPCGTCHATGKTPYLKEDGTMGERVCQSCGGTLLERVTTKERLFAMAERMKYKQPQLRAVEHSGSVASVDFNAMTPEQLAAMEQADELFRKAGVLKPKP